MSRIAMFGGTFNPPHEGHLSAARAAVEALALDKIIFMPTATPPHKKMPRFSATAGQRLYMTRLAAETVKNAEVSDLEIRRGGASYTCDTLSELRKLYPADELYLIVGTDMLETLDRWVEPQKICSLAKIAAVARRAGEREKLMREKSRLLKILDADITVIDHTPVDMSSTEARGGETDLLPEKVREYIKNECLYVDFDSLSARVAARLSEKRFRHTQGVASLAAKLAPIYGETENRAVCAALLHDVTKELSPEEQKALAAKYGVAYDYDDGDFRQLIHADTAAAVAEHEFSMCPDVCRAIRHHTVGSTEMTALDKIIFTADACEINRRWDDAPQMRQLAAEDLDEAVIKLMDDTIKRLEKSGKKPYYKTQDALNALRADRKEGIS